MPLYRTTRSTETSKTKGPSKPTGTTKTTINNQSSPMPFYPAFPVVDSHLRCASNHRCPGYLRCTLLLKPQKKT